MCENLDQLLFSFEPGELIRHTHFGVCIVKSILEHHTLEVFSLEEQKRIFLNSKRTDLISRIGARVDERKE